MKLVPSIHLYAWTGLAHRNRLGQRSSKVAFLPYPNALLISSVPARTGALVWPVLLRVLFRSAKRPPMSICTMTCLAGYSYKCKGKTKRNFERTVVCVVCELRGLPNIVAAGTLSPRAPTSPRALISSSITLRYITFLWTRRNGDNARYRNPQETRMIITGAHGSAGRYRVLVEIAQSNQTFIPHTRCRSTFDKFVYCTCIFTWCASVAQLHGARLG